jgi:hypothetical protein
MTKRNSAHSKPPVRDSGHLRTRWLDEQQAEDRQSRQAADIRIEFLEAIDRREVCRNGSATSQSGC